MGSSFRCPTSHIHTHTLTHIFTYIYIYIHTHTHTHTLSLSFPFSSYRTRTHFNNICNARLPVSLTKYNDFKMTLTIENPNFSCLFIFRPIPHKVVHAIPVFINARADRQLVVRMHAWRFIAARCADGWRLCSQRELSAYAHIIGLILYFVSFFCIFVKVFKCAHSLKSLFDFFLHILFLLISLIFSICGFCAPFSPHLDSAFCVRVFAANIYRGWLCARS